MLNYLAVNEYTYRLRNKNSGVISRNIHWCYGNIFEQIEKYKKDLSKMCYIGVSNETHEIIEVIHNFNNKTIYKIQGGN